MRKLLSRQRGFTLMELIIAALSVGVIALAGAIVVSLIHMMIKTW